MLFETPILTPAIPEIFVLSMTCVMLLAELFLGKAKRLGTYLITQSTLLVATVLTLMLLGQAPVETFGGSFILDNLSILMKVFIYITSFFAFWYARDYIHDRKMPEGEYYALGLFSILGMMVLVSAHSFLTLFLGVELLSLPLYAMVAMRRESDAGAEGAMKYFVMGALASAMLLYGMSMLYGATKSLHVAVVASTVATFSSDQNLILVFGLVFVVAGLAFKLGAAPFHMWVPDVYQGAPTPVTLFIGAAPKIAALGMTIRLLVDALPGLIVQWQQLLIVVALVSVGLGNVVAIVQTNLKRMLSYSAIAHMGYMSLGLLAITPDGYAAAVFYVIAYALMTLSAFGMLILLSRAGFDAENISDLRGLNTRDPWLAFMMLLTMFSMAGVPPSVGFFAKLGVLEALIENHLVWIAIVALVFAIIGAYYYIAVVKTMYFEGPEETAPLTTSYDMRLAITVNGLLILALGLFPSGLITLCRQAFQLI